MDESSRICVRDYEILFARGDVRLAVGSRRTAYTASPDYPHPAPYAAFVSVHAVAVWFAPGGGSCPVTFANSSTFTPIFSSFCRR